RQAVQCGDPEDQDRGGLPGHGERVRQLASRDISIRSSCPALCRASTSLVPSVRKTWMAGTSPAMTKLCQSSRLPPQLPHQGAGRVAEQLLDRGRVELVD